MDTAAVARVLAARRAPILARAVALWKVSRYSGSGALLDRTGRGRDLTLGSTSGADANDPLYLPYTGTVHVYLPGTAGNYASAPDSAAVSITSAVLDVDGYVALTDWTSGAIQAVVSKWTTTGDQRSYALYVTATGFVQMFWSTLGTSVTATSATSTLAVPVTDGAGIYVRATRDPATGTVRFYTSTDGSAWTKLGDDVAGSTGNIFDGTAVIQIGTVDGDTAFRAAGKVYRVRIYSGLRDSGGTLAFDCDFTDLSKYAAGYGSLTEKSVNAATVTLNRSASGRKLAVVDEPLFLAGTDDYLETPFHADFQFDADDSFTILLRMRLYGTPGASTVVLANNAAFSGANPGVNIRHGGDGRMYMRLNDGVVSTDVRTPLLPSGTTFVAAFRRNGVTKKMQAFIDAVPDAEAVDSTTGSLVNANPLRLFRFTGASTSYSDGELMRASVIREALGDSDIARAGRELLPA